MSLTPLRRWFARNEDMKNLPTDEGREVNVKSFSRHMSEAAG
jgi:hypothetical protein